MRQSFCIVPGTFENNYINNDNNNTDEYMECIRSNVIKLKIMKRVTK